MVAKERVNRSHLKLVTPTKPSLSTRPFKTDYAGAWSGSCKTREGAVIAAVKHIMRDGYTRATITNTYTGEEVARVRLSSDRRSATIETSKIIRKIGG